MADYAEHDFAPLIAISRGGAAAFVEERHSVLEPSPAVLQTTRSAGRNVPGAYVTRARRWISRAYVAA
jgi:hypothetical protein